MESAGITPVRNGVNMSRHGGPLVINEPRSGEGVGGGGDADSNPALGRCWKGQLQLVLAAATSPRRGTESLLMSLVCDRKIMWRVGVVGWVGGEGGWGVGGGMEPAQGYLRLQQ